MYAVFGLLMLTGVSACMGEAVVLIMLLRIMVLLMVLLTVLAFCGDRGSWVRSAFDCTGLMFSRLKELGWAGGG